MGTTKLEVTNERCSVRLTYSKKSAALLTPWISLTHDPIFTCYKDKSWYDESMIRENFGCATEAT